jgi:hypothetical protein
MLDVHPPHEAAHSWKDFFIHIITIVIGLLIAVGLEQAVEAVHHHGEVSETREALKEELDANHKVYQQNVRSYLIDEATIYNNRGIFEFLRDHPGTPEDKLPGVVTWTLSGNPPVTAAWSTAEHTTILSLMPREEVRRDTSLYALLRNAEEAANNALAVGIHCADYTSSFSDVARLRPAEIEQEVQCTRQMAQLHLLYGEDLQEIGQQPGFGPGLTSEECNQFSHFTESRAYRKAHPEVFAPTQRLIDKALASRPAKASARGSFLQPSLAAPALR